MALKDPTAWKDDLTFYMTEESVADSVDALEPVLAQGGSRLALGGWIALIGTLGAVFGATTLSPDIRQPLTFAGYVAVAALLLRGLLPLTRRFFGRGAGFVIGFAFFWAFLLGLLVVLSAGRESRWWAYGLSVGGGFFVGMMYGSFPPNVIRNQDAWMLSFLIAPVASFAATYLLRHMFIGVPLEAALAAGALAGLLYMGPMAALMIHLWDESEALAELAVVYLHNDTFATAAVAHLDRAIALQPANPRYYTLRGVGFSQLGDPERAAADWDKASELAPGSPEPHVQRGVDYLRRSAWHEAIRAFERAIEKDGKHGRAHGYLGVAWERLGDLQQAFARYDQAVTLAPDDAKVHVDRSYANFRRGEHAKALRDAQRATRLESHLGIAYAALGQALMGVGKPDAARDAFHEAIDLGLEPDVHQDVLRKLEPLGDVDDDADDDEAEG